MNPFSADITKLPVVGYFIGWLKDNNFDYGLHVTIFCILMLYFIYSSSQILLTSSFSFFLTLAPIWFPILAFGIFHFRWMDYVHKKFYLNSGRTLYRLKLPKEVHKSPEAMEFVLHQIWSLQNPDNYMETYLVGKFPLPIGLEIASIGGDVRFYININTKKGTESLIPAIYSQYPGIELIEEPVDYAAEIAVNYDKMDMWVSHVTKKEKKWAPIKTYIDFELNKMPKEEEKIDPITPTIELLGGIEPHEHFYIQYIISGFRKSSFYNGQLMAPWKEGPNWTKAGQDHIDEIMQRDPVTKAPLSSEGSDFDGMPRITPGERGMVEAIERNIEKYGFNVGIRYLYASEKGKFRSGLINAVNRTLAQYDKVGQGTMGVRWRTDFDYKFLSDPFGDKLEMYRQASLKLYMLRIYANFSQADNPKVMTTEELATIFHIPGTVSITPGLGRIPSTRSEAPSNLPVGNLPT